MSKESPAITTSIVAPVITEKGDARRREQSGRLQGRAQRDEAADQGGGREAVRRQGRRRQHACRARARRRLFAACAAMQSDVKKAVVTLAEGHPIDVTTGL